MPNGSSVSQEIGDCRLCGVLSPRTRLTALVGRVSPRSRGSNPPITGGLRVANVADPSYQATILLNASTPPQPKQPARNSQNSRIEGLAFVELIFYNERCYRTAGESFLGQTLQKRGRMRIVGIRPGRATKGATARAREQGRVPRFPESMPVDGLPGPASRRRSGSERLMRKRRGGWRYGLVGAGLTVALAATVLAAIPSLTRSYFHQKRLPAHLSTSPVQRTDLVVSMSASGPRG